jgi:branched-subunit amino acid transport protein
MHGLSALVLILGMALVTFTIRYPLLAFVGRVELPDRMVRALRYVPVAVLIAIIVPTMLMPHDHLEIAFGNSYLIAGMASMVIAAKFKRLLPTIGGGMLIFLLWQWLT